MGQAGQGTLAGDGRPALNEHSHDHEGHVHSHTDGCDHSHAHGDHDLSDAHAGHDHSHEHAEHDSPRPARGHSHSHGHGHSHGPASYGTAFAIGVTLNLGFVIAEFVFGFAANSLALVSDAGHNLSDVMGLILAWGASTLGRRPPSLRRTYGFRRTTILAALTNAVVLLIVTGAISWEAILRFQHPAPVASDTIMWVAALGVVINTATALMFMRGRKDDLNVEGAFLHMASDAAVAAGVVVAGFAMKKTGWLWIDPAMSLLVGLVIVLGTWRLLCDSVHLALDGVPSGINPEDVRAYLGSLPAVTEVHDLHIWGMSTTETALTAHLVRSDPSLDCELLTRVAKELKTRFRIDHMTVQFELESHTCEQAPEGSL